MVRTDSLHVRHGQSAKDVVHQNLIPPHPEAFIGYLTGRKHLIARIADHELGIWQEDASGREPAGLDTLTSVEYGRMLELYLGLSQNEVEDALGRMIAAGDNELALKLAVAAVSRYGDSNDGRAETRRTTRDASGCQAETNVSADDGIADPGLTCACICICLTA